MEAALRCYACRVSTVATASEAEHRCRQRGYDLVICRILFLAGINGIDLAERLRELDTPIVLFSEFPEQILRTLQGFPPPDVAFFRVPRDMDRLIATALAIVGRCAEATPQVLPAPAHETVCGTWEVDLKSNTVRLSREYYALFGTEPDVDIRVLESLERHVHPEDRDAVRRAFDEAVRERHQLYRARFRIVRADGSVEMLCVTGRIEYGEHSEPVRVRGITTYEPGYGTDT